MLHPAQLWVRHLTCLGTSDTLSARDEHSASEGPSEKILIFGIF